MAVDGIVDQTLKFSSIVDCRVHVQFPLCSQQLNRPSCSCAVSKFSSSSSSHYL